MTAFPSDLPLELDGSVRVLARGRTLLGGDPLRLLRLSVSGVDVLARLRTHGASNERPASGRLARRLVDGGFAHPRPARAPAADVTVVVPVRDRAEMLDACLERAGAAVVVVDDGSRDPAAIAAACARHGARLVRRAACGGPAAARNTGLALVDTPLVAFLDSDCIAPGGWLEALTGHFADPLVAAVAPRVRPTTSGRGSIAAFAAARSPLDLGPRPARVVPMGRVSYVPTAALVVRRSAITEPFDENLRYGEDVDFVWRLHASGWHVRYEPAVSVHHREPTRWRELAGRHYRYGTSAGPLATRHPGRLAPLAIHPWSAATAACVLAGRPRSAAALLAVQAALVTRRMRPAGVPTWRASSWPLRGAVQTTLAAGHTLATLAPAILVAALASRRGRLPALVLGFGPPLAEWGSGRPRLDPVRWTALCLADDVAYGLGVWAGCLHARTLAPVRPVFGRPMRADESRSALPRDRLLAGRPRQLLHDERS